MQRFVAWMAALLLMPLVAAHATETTGAGSTFVYPIIAKWSAAYASATGNKINYQPIGSGAGLAQIKSATVDFGASDMPMKPAELEKLDLAQFPLVVGGVVPVVNLEGVAPGTLRFTGELLANIYLGKIKAWDDPSIQKVNPDLKLPSLPISVVYRSDGSGTTFNWANYLSKSSPEWRQSVGEGTSLSWPVGIGGKGNEGVAAVVQQTKGAIGYVEYAYVLQKQMSFGLVRNKAGQFIRPETESFQAAAETADWANAKDFSLLMTDAPGEKAYPVTATVFILMHKKSKDAERARVALEFFRWSLEKGQRQAQELNYVPLPPALVERVEAYWKAQFMPNGG